MRPKGNEALKKSVLRYLQYLIILLVRRLVLLLPRKTALKMGVYLADLMFLLFPKERAKVMANLNLAFGSEKKQREIYRICRYCFRNLGKGMMEVMQFEYTWHPVQKMDQALQLIVKMADEGFCPALVFDDDGRWALSFEGVSGIKFEEDSQDLDMRIFVKKHEWNESLTRAICEACLRAVREFPPRSK